jgi:hypothetical protein
MTTITINEKSKVGKTLLDLARLLSKESNEVFINESNEIIATSVKGYSINKKEYISLVKEADDRISSGIFTTSDDLDNEIKGW